MLKPKGVFSFEKVLKTANLSFICECKKASPSKGTIAQDFPCLKIAKEYEIAGADCISVLTEPKWFLGSKLYLNEITASISLPCLRKDFFVDEYMIYESKLLGASAILLVCSILTEKQIKDYIEICDSLDLSALVETHNEVEIELAMNANARVIGINNRNLRNFSIDTSNSKILRSLVPPVVLFVSESGIKTSHDIMQLRTIGVDAVLIGEVLMRATDKRAMLTKLKGTDD